MLHDLHHRWPALARARALGRAGLLAAEALLVLVLVRMLIRLSLRCLLRPLVRWALAEPCPALPQPPRGLQRRVQGAIRRASAFVPAAHPCLAEAIAGKWLLQRRGFGAHIHLGVCRADAAAAGPGLHAHAWLEAGGPILTGIAAAGRMSRIAR